MSFIVVIKCFLIYSSLIYRKNLVESADTSSVSSPCSRASGANEGQQASGTPASGGTTTGADAGSGTKTGVELSLKATASTDQFDHSKNNKIVTYTAKDNYGFKSVKTGDKVVWQTDKEAEYAKEVVLNGKGNEKKEVTIHLPNGTKKVFKRENKGKPWIEGSQPAKDTAKTTSTTTASGTPPASGTSPTSGGGAGTGNKTGVGINVDSDKSTDQFDCIKNGRHRTYIPKGNNAFKFVSELIDNNWVNVWSETDPKKYSNKVEVDLLNNNSKAVTVYLDGNETIVYTKNVKNKSWDKVDLAKLNPRSVNIKYQYDSYFCTNKLDNNVRTFEAKKGFAFKLVYEYVDQNNRPEIWKTEQEKEYANKVVSEEKKVIIHRGDETIKVFKKESDGKWTEDTEASTKATNDQKTSSEGSGGTTQTSPTGGGTTGTGGSTGTGASGGGAGK
ncbi:uncharacterized protein TOT_030000636 [Theileria orientalis strain Shintoku]|uniref:Uncharacterized protein n=1 Tax=Theileria orientalis strain Shintoku TaxID=869250 RepID=J4DPV7_THEOR|nr:uncharacterized protein TOT_030000636 [Theileria orientalis strain Shintoku]BAM41374.1 uncharacterized protein TOT_030000636 [Theileria orientalis strain Shintoku]|eukprot:XP_009691675.1 uncharacterized protein TOT_030000636 [Theileria orientalis strain Shintoku]